MLITSFARALPVFAIAVMAFAGNVQAQRLIIMDSESCTGGLQALAPIIGGEIKLSGAPRSFAGKCEASDVMLKLKSGTAVRLDKVQWGKGQLAPLAQDKLPKALNLVITGAHITTTPEPGSPLAFLAQDGILSAGINATLAFSYVPEQGELTLGQASLHFADGNLITLSAKLRGVIPALPAAPQLGIVPIQIEDLTLNVETGRRLRNPAYSLAAYKVRAANPNMRDSALKSAADAYIVKEMPSILDKADLQDLRRFIADAPTPQKPMTLRLTSADGFALGRLIGLESGTGLDQVFDGAGISFRYGR